MSKMFQPSAASSFDLGTDRDAAGRYDPYVFSMYYPNANVGGPSGPYGAYSGERVDTEVVTDLITTGVGLVSTLAPLVRGKKAREAELERQRLILAQQQLAQGNFVPAWVWLAGGVVLLSVLGGGGFLLAGRRR